MVYDPTKDPLLKQIRAMIDERVSTMSPEQQVAHIIARRRDDQEAARRTEWRRQQELERQQAAEARRKEAEFAFGQDIRNRFFQANPQATQADFERVWPELRDEAMVARMDQPEGGDKEIERRNPRYNI